ncbi:MAG TPA: MBL fold metallo-hydrolase, partial [Nitrospirota bacterium]
MQAENISEGIVRLKENIYQIRGKCMVYLIKGAKKNILIDAGLATDMAVIESQLHALGLEKEDIHLVVLTHEHIDHIGGVPLLSNRTVIS